ncbi:DUF4810 domain-containing protein [Burkholderia dolosa]|uniref:DUF4810 domain-containing protein n=1 Tax=Burkholderia dolosa TaxID=152500 RepID=A0A892IA85_9BURK|nr:MULTISPECIES: DUF4810 domain-containing protein [Burkholderia]AKE02496.1 lipoprotein [Burkholderia cepacia]AJY13739.1 hypothetical protein AK34_106 [Burkholderia dolosa AU0158]AYZ97244.1 DUF4810 domain-containing protein [Burkholderia dolosa]EAY67699.1 hypothetical protein BDAG_00386 [Burkholderia dolosa AU0158]ETP64284.1 hypothetical protein BDSB_02300 [Burkholderia dolosa PC543]
MKRGNWLPATAAVLLLAGCANTTPPLYQWTGYQPQVYEYFKGQKSPQEQIDALEKALQEIRGKGHMPPPGFHAHLGMLYASIGSEQQAEQELQAEKQLFPESSTYMDFLLKKKTGEPKAADQKTADQNGAAQTVAGQKNADSTTAKQ